MSSLSSVIRETLSRNEVAAKKQITLFLEMITLEKLDRISKEFSRLNESRSFSRNSLIEMASAPLNGITHYAKVKGIVPNIIFDGKATAMRPPRYTTLEKLLTASVVSNLFK